MNRRGLGTAILAIALSGSVVGCGYHVAGRTSNALPKSIHVIAVPAMENKTTTFKVEQKLTAATIHEFLVKTNYKVVSDPNGGDAVLTGKVLSLEVVPLLYQSATSTSSTTQATAMLVTMKCEVTLTERDNEKVLYHTNNFVFRNEYQLGTTGTATPTQGQVESFFQEGEPALDRMAQDFASAMVSTVMENY